MHNVVTFDLFSALIDSRTGGSATFARWAACRSWPVTGEEVYDTWDRFNKAAQASCNEWVPYVVLAERALCRAYRELDLNGDVAADIAALLDSQAQWPLWPDVVAGVHRIAASHRIGILSNVDDALLLRSRAGAFAIPELVFTSERLGVYKPNALIYERVRDLCGGDVIHVATSARDVRGALEAGIDVIRLRRAGHSLDPGGPTPKYEVDDMEELARSLGR